MSSSTAPSLVSPPRVARRPQRPSTSPRCTAGRRRRGGRSAWLAVLALALCGLAAPARAQTITGALQGKVVRGGEAQAGARITATSLTTGAVVTVTAGGDGAYVVAGLAPGQYLIAAAASGGETTQLVDLGIGQTLDIALDIGAAAVQGAERIEVSGRRVEVRTSEVATDVGQAEIANLPQNSRNFLNFASLAPGIRQSTDELKRDFSSGGLGAQQTNVFIDGISLKNNLTDTGVVGQDSSRGNVFPQLAVAGFRVLTQNYKAEYEQAATAIISAITRSGGNEPHGELYGAYQDRHLVAIDPFAEKMMQPKPDYSRYQFGGLLSGPIIEDRLFALATYEGNYQNRAGQVAIGDTTDANLMRFGRYQGSFTSPFREHLGFGKLTWLPDPAHTVDLTLDLKRETDIRSFGGTTSFENAENVRNDIAAVSLRHQFRADTGVVNEATAQVMQTSFNPGAENPDLVGQDFAGVIRIGGRDTGQDLVQRTVMLRDDVTFPVFHAAGAHQFKTGAKLAFQHYQIEKTQFGNPLFSYRVDPGNQLDFDAPFQAQFGVGNPRVATNNTQIGLYAQDDWQVDDRLTLNLGLRWDLETNPFNNDFKTPDNVRAAATDLAARVAPQNGADFFPVDDYLNDGSQRPVYVGEIQPRIGASYDVLGDQHTVVFAGAGRYFDRTPYNNAVDERYRLQYAVRTFQFSRDGQPRDGQPTIVWDPSYLSRQGLQGLIDRGVAPDPEIFLMANNTRPPHTDQLSAGVRQVVGPVNVSVTVAHIRGENGLGFYPANRERTGNRDFLPVPGFGNVLISSDAIQSRFTGVYVTAEKPYTEASRWGVTAAYTLGWSKIRGDLFNFDFPTIKDTPTTPGDADERHRLVVGAIGGLPYGIKVSTLITLGSGLPFNVTDASAGFGADQKFERNGGRADGLIQFKQIDIRIAKQLDVAAGHHASAFLEVFNLFNWANYGGYDGFLPPTAGDPNPSFGKPSVLIGPTRSLQLGLSYGF
jgi:TonB-dependent receptor-like protein/carboxypeptidase family protein